jgi:hypothetical protein
MIKISGMQLLAYHEALGQGGLADTKVTHQNQLEGAGRSNEYTRTEQTPYLGCAIKYA